MSDRKNQLIVGLAAFGLIAAAVAVGIAVTQGSSNAPEAPSGAEASALPTSSATAETPTPEQVERQNLIYNLSSHYFIDPSFYDHFKGVDTSGPYGYSDVTPYLDKTELRATIQDLLDNHVYVYETGDADGLLATFEQTTSGEFAGGGTAEDLLNRHQTAAEWQTKDASLPLTSMSLETVDAVTPTADRDELSVSFTYLDTVVGEPAADGNAATATYRRHVEWTLRREEVTGWSDGGSRVTWVIRQVFLQDTEQVS